MPSGFISLSCKGESLSARRAWIEIESRITEDLEFDVALRKESVDRNAWCSCY